MQSRVYILTSELTKYYEVTLLDLFNFKLRVCNILECRNEEVNDKECSYDKCNNVYVVSRFLRSNLFFTFNNFNLISILFSESIFNDFNNLSD